MELPFRDLDISGGTSVFSFNMFAQWDGYRQNSWIKLERLASSCKQCFASFFSHWPHLHFSRAFQFVTAGWQMSWHDVYVILEDSMPLNSLYVKAATILENIRPALESSWVSSVFRPLEPRGLANAPETSRDDSHIFRKRRVLNTLWPKGLPEPFLLREFCRPSAGDLVKSSWCREWYSRRLDMSGKTRIPYFVFFA